MLDDVWVAGTSHHKKNSRVIRSKVLSQLKDQDQDNPLPLTLPPSHTSCEYEKNEHSNTKQILDANEALKTNKRTNLNS